MPSDKKYIIGGIVKHNNGMIGFRLSFNTQEQAQHYKEMIQFIVRSDDFEVLSHNGYFDKKG